MNGNSNYQIFRTNFNQIKQALLINLLVKQMNLNYENYLLYEDHQVILT